jgi:small subunit ribosomal protein S1
VVEGVVRNLTSYGAFIEIADGLDGLLHVSDMSWTKRIANPAEMLEKGQKVRAVVLSVHPDKKRIALGLKQLELDPWQKEILERFGPETEHVGTVTKVTNFGVFVALDMDLEGLLHISELTPADRLQANDRVAVKVLRLDTEERKIGLTLIRGDHAADMLAKAPPAPPLPPPREIPPATDVGDEPPPPDEEPA